MSIGQNINNRCQELGITIKDLSKLSKVPYSTVRDMANDKNSPSVDKIKKIAIALHVTTDQLLFEDDEINADDELKRLFIEVKNMRKENQRMIKEMIKAVIIQNKSQELSQEIKKVTQI